MAHYAILDENNVVIQVITGRHEYEVVDGISDWEAHYREFHQAECKRTSYNTSEGQHDLGGIPFRKNYAVVGGVYDETRNAFIPPQPYPSWVLDEDTCLWDAPVPYPDDGLYYDWDGDTVSWVQIDAGS